MPATTTPTPRESIRRAMFNQGAPMSAGTIHERVYQGTHIAWPSVERTQQTLDAMEADGQVTRTGDERWGFSYWLKPLEGFDR